MHYLNQMIEYVIISTIIISLFALTGVITFYIKDKILNKLLLLFVSLSAGALLGGAFFHLLPEAISEIDIKSVSIITLSGFVLFFLIEKILHWRHCHKVDCKIHTFGYINLIGDSIHNFIDGLIIAASYASNIGLGIATTLAVALHEIPQEIGDFGVLLHSGMHKKKAISYNFLVATTVVIGGIVGILLSNQTETILPYLLPFAAGGFIYISSSDLIPEIRKEKQIKKWSISFIIFLLGIALMYGLTILE